MGCSNTSSNPQRCLPPPLLHHDPAPPRHRDGFVLLAHHDVEENIMFPILNTKLDFSEEEEQYKAMYDAVDKFATCVRAARVDNTKFDATLLIDILEGAKDVLREMMESSRKYTLKHDDPFVMLPFLMGHTPPEYKSWPPLLWVVAKLILQWIIGGGIEDGGNMHHVGCHGSMSVWSSNCIVYQLLLEYMDHAFWLPASLLYFDAQSRRNKSTSHQWPSRQTTSPDWYRFCTNLQGFTATNSGKTFNRTAGYSMSKIYDCRSEKTFIAI
ncbi:hypothetical protein V1508DRAFT_451139 [Lipomyces doorenjongii]|uniref:uncharacterized protein n=1 Tax=Lipomyces doorenjongii TaxID=383834 RepID=UPI0034CE1BE1